ncbi:MAG TPA: hypothetical protein VMI55_02730 [Thermoplasmata archaeon]|nr:hypothetical protein [Thermoplasmata archaeon]
MSHIFQRPLCDLGIAFDYSFRASVGDPDPGLGGGCDTRPHRVELYSVSADPRTAPDEWRAFSLCEEHEGQLRGIDTRLTGSGRASRFRPVPPRTARA